MIRDNYLDITKLTTSSQIMELFHLIARHGGVLRFVGGAVRDALKNIKGSDLNLVTDLSPEELAEACADEGIRTVPLGIKQGTIGVVIGETLIEVSSLCKCIKNKDGILEKVFTDNWEEDASQRDLTINAVYADEKGNVFDYYNGIEDLEKGYVRFIGLASDRIKEDCVRILRYFRFYSLFGLDEPNAKAIKACADNCSGLKKVPMETIRDELFKIILTPKATKAYRLMQKHNILGYVMPDASYIDDLEFLNMSSSFRFIKNEALIKMFILYRPNFALAENLANRMKFSKKDKILFTLLASTNISLDCFLNTKCLEKYIYNYGLEFCQAKFVSLMASTRVLPENYIEIYDNMEKIKEPIFPIKGKDLIDCQLINHNQIGFILKKLEQIWIESNFDLTKEQLLLEVDNLKNVT